MRRMTAILDAFALTPLISGLPRDAEAVRQQKRRLRTSPDRSPDLRRCSRLLVKMDPHRPPSGMTR